MATQLPSFESLPYRETSPKALAKNIIGPLPCIFIAPQAHNPFSGRFAHANKIQTNNYPPISSLPTKLEVGRSRRSLS